MPRVYKRLYTLGMIFVGMRTEEAEDVEDENQTFEKRQLLRQESIEHDSHSDDGDCEKNAVPVLGNVVGLVKRNQSLDLQRNSKTLSANSGLPTKHAKPACNTHPWSVLRKGTMLFEGPTHQ